MWRLFLCFRLLYILNLQPLLLWGYTGLSAMQFLARWNKVITESLNLFSHLKAQTDKWNIIETKCKFIPRPFHSRKQELTVSWIIVSEAGCRKAHPQNSQMPFPQLCQWTAVQEWSSQTTYPEAARVVPIYDVKLFNISCSWQAVLSRLPKTEK